MLLINLIKKSEQVDPPKQTNKKKEKPRLLTIRTNKILVPSV